MAAATADRDDQRSEGRLKALGVAAATLVYKGILVGCNAAGYLVPLEDTAGLTFQGVSFERADNTVGAAANGSISCRVRLDGEFLFSYPGAGALQAQVGGPAYLVDDNSVTSDPTATLNAYL